MIDEAIDAVGDFGEVHLVVNKGRLRFVITQKVMISSNIVLGRSLQNSDPLFI